MGWQWDSQNAGIVVALVSLDLGAVRFPLMWLVSSGYLFVHASLSCGSAAGRPQLLTSIITRSDHVFLGLPRPLVPVIGRSVTDVIEDIACCRAWRTVLIFSMPSLCNSEAEGVLSKASLLQMQRIMTSLRWSCCSFVGFVPNVVADIFKD